MKVVVNCLAGLLCYFELNRPTSFLLPDDCSVQGVPVGRQVIDLDGDNIAAPQLAVDCEVEQSKVPGAALELQFGSNGPYVARPKRRFRSYQLTFVPRFGRRT
jgi:hypothetical protein